MHAERSVGTRALVLVPVLTGRAGGSDNAGVHTPAERLLETRGLAEAIDLEVVAEEVVRLANARPGTLIGSGKVEEIAANIQAAGIGLVVIDHPVTPIQQRNLEVAWKTKVLDRTGLILEIFGRRARTREGRLQVELAHLTYQRGRLVRSWTHLERQRGGFGFLGGPGETQIETDRRLIQERISKIKAELEGVVRTRELHRAGRSKVPYPIVALVGYTNAGKSTLFNTLTGAEVFAKDQVFATLDPTMRELELPSGRKVILSDTVGFIANLPTMLIAAFRATLEEVVGADVILHVRDIAHPESEAQRQDVEAVLADLNIEPSRDQGGPAMIDVWNKIDLLDGERREILANSAARTEAPTVLISAVTGAGLDTLLDEIDALLGAEDLEMDLVVAAEDGALLSWVFEHATVLKRALDEDGNSHLHVRVGPDKRGQLEARLRAGN